MIEKNYIINFVKKIIENGDSQNREATRKMILNLQEYLSLTKSLSEEDSKGLERVIDCLDEILTIKEKTGHIVDIGTIFIKERMNEENIEKEKSPVLRKGYINPSKQEKNNTHYSHYESYGSSSCGSVGSSHC